MSRAVKGTLVGAQKWVPS